jgi:GNAT superfamily N-acetyltransferase
MLKVDTLGPADRAAWTGLFRAYHAFYGRPEVPAAELDRSWQEFGNRVHALGARLDGELVGIAHFLVHPSTTSADVCYLQDLFTAPVARGHGVARALIAAVGDWARAQGCCRVYWHTKEDNTTARYLYDKVAENRGFIQYVVPL